jgi:hypothetical protein
LDGGPLSQRDVLLPDRAASLLPRDQSRNQRQDQQGAGDAELAPSDALPDSGCGVLHAFGGEAGVVEIALDVVEVARVGIGPAAGEFQFDACVQGAGVAVVAVPRAARSPSSRCNRSPSRSWSSQSRSRGQYRMTASCASSTLSRSSVSRRLRVSVSSTESQISGSRLGETG